MTRPDPPNGGAVSKSVRRHLDDLLGAPAEIEAFPAHGGFGELEIAIYADQPTATSSTLVTIGISEDVVAFGPHTDARMEVSMSIYSSQLPESKAELTRILGATARISVASGRGWAPGSLLPFSGPLIDGLQFETAYSADISYLAPEVRIVPTTTPRTYISWLVPVFKVESTFIIDHGWQAFESALQADGEIDLMDLNRPPVRLP